MKFKTLFASVALAAIAMSAVGPAMAQELTADQKVEQYDLAQANKELVTSAYQALFGDKDVTALDRYFAKDYIQHNPNVLDGTEALAAALKQWGVLDQPKSTLDFVRVIAEGDLVMLQQAQPTADGPVLVIVDIFRVENGKIAEHWDVMQTEPTDKPNPRPMY